MSRESDPVPNFTLGQLKTFLETSPAEPVETDFFSCREWAKSWDCSRRLAQKTLRKVMEQGALETKKGRRLAIDGLMRTVVLYKINIKAEEEAPA